MFREQGTYSLVSIRSSFLIERSGIKYSFQNFSNIVRDKNMPIYKTEKYIKYIQKNSPSYYN